jgi:hypothetical protein
MLYSGQCECRLATQTSIDGEDFLASQDIVHECNDSLTSGWARDSVKLHFIHQPFEIDQGQAPSDNQFLALRNPSASLDHAVFGWTLHSTRVVNDQVSIRNRIRQVIPSLGNTPG